MGSSSYLLISLAAGSLLLLAAGVLWVLANQWASPTDVVVPRERGGGCGRLIALAVGWLSTGGQFFAAFILFGISSDDSSFKDILAATLMAASVATLVINTVSTLHWMRLGATDGPTMPSSRRRPLLIAYSVVVALVAVISATMFWFAFVGNRSFLNADSAACLFASIATFIAGWIATACSEAPAEPMSPAHPPLYRNPRTLLRVIAVIFVIWGVVCWSWLGVVPGAIWLLVIWSTVAARSRAGELTSLWTLSIATRFGSLQGPQIWQHMRRVQGPAQRRLKRLAALLGDGEPLDLALQRCRIIPRSCSMEVQAALDADRLSEALRSAAVRETKRFAQGPEVTEAFSISYFALMINVMLFITGFLMYYIVPKFKKIFEDFGTELPKLTILLIQISDGFVNYWYLFLPWILPASFFALWCDMQARFYGWRALFERLFGSFWPRLRSPDILRGLAWGIRGDRPLAETLAAMTLGQATLTTRNLIRHAAEQVRGGENVWTVLAQHGWLNAAECDALQRAQAVGNLPWVLEALAEADEQRWERRMSYRLQLIRPILVTVMGLMVAFIAIAMFMPLVKLLNDLS